MGTTIRERLNEAIFARVAGPQGTQHRDRIHGTPGPRWFAPGSPITRVHGDASMYVGGLRAVLLQTLQPQATRYNVDCFHGTPQNPGTGWMSTAQDAAPYLRTAGAVTLVAHTHKPAVFLAQPDRDPVALRPQAGESVDFGDSGCVLNPGAVMRPQLDVVAGTYL